MQVQSVQSLSHVRISETPWAAACQASLSITNSLSLLRFMYIKSVMSSNHLILCHPLFLLPSIFPSIRIFSNESVLRIKWPKYWSFSFSIRSSNDFLQDGLFGSPCSPRDSQESSPAPQFKSINSSALSLLYSPILTSIHENWKSYSVDQMDFCCQSNVSAFNMLSRLVIREGNGNPLQYSCLENPMDGEAWQAAVHGVAKSRTRLRDFTFTFHFHALEKETATHSSVPSWRIPGTGEPGGLPSVGLHRVGHD